MSAREVERRAWTQDRVNAWRQSMKDKLDQQHAAEDNGQSAPQPGGKDDKYSQDLGNGVILLEDDSSYIVYGGENWLRDHKEDSMTPQYRTGTFHSSTKPSSWALVNWNGTDIGVYGAKRDNHGYYAIVVDNGQVQYFNGYSTNAEFQTPLFESKDLSAGMHQLLIVNQNQYGDQPNPKNVWLDIDFIQITGVPVDPRFAVMPTGGVTLDAASTSDTATSSFSESSSALSTVSSISSTIPSPSESASTLVQTITRYPTSIVSKSPLASSSSTSNGSIPNSQAAGLAFHVHAIQNDMTALTGLFSLLCVIWHLW